MTSFAAESTEPAASNDAIDQTLTDIMKDVESFIAAGKVDLNIRTRYEWAKGGVNAVSNAATIRTRLGYTTDKYNGFQAAVQMENNTPFDYSGYNAAGLNGQPGQEPIADPRDTELNQAWLSYDFSETAGVKANTKVGRQRIILGNARFVGNVGWRQLEQTFDAARVDFSEIEDVKATYAYVWNVNRIFGPSAGAASDFDSDSHLIDVAYSGLGNIGTLKGFAYLLDFSDSAANSNQTYGVHLDGSQNISEGFDLAYSLSYAFQSDYGSNATSYNADYALAEVKAKFEGGTFIGGGFEMLGADASAAADPGAAQVFRTPLATAHKFNGFADSFLATPAGGLRDYYVTAGTTLPYGIKLSAWYHIFTGDDSGNQLGTEFDLVLAKKLTDKTSVLFKGAVFNGQETTEADIHRFTIQLDFNY